MTIKKIKILENKGDEKIYFSGRSIEVHTSKHSAKGPNRCSTSTEYNSLIKIPAQRTYIPDFISIIPRKLSKNEVTSFVQENGIHKKIADYLTGKIPSTRYSSIILSPIILPKLKQFNNKSYQTFGRRSLFVQNIVKESLGNTKNEFLPSLYIYPKLSISSINSIFTTMSKYDNWVPVIPMDMPKKSFKNSIDCVVDNIETYHIPLVLFTYSDPLSNLENYDYIWNKNDQEIIFSMCDTPREKINNLSTSHYLHTLGLDFIGRKVYHFGGKSKPSDVPFYKRVKYFDKNDLIIKTEISNNNQIKLFDVMPKDDRIKKIYDNRSAAKDDNDLGVLKSISNVHEFYASTKEFDTVSKYIANNEYLEYLETKKILKGAVSTLSKLKE